jgi:hypothetical protein
MAYVLRIWSDPASIGRLAIRLTLLAIRRIAGAPSLAAFAADMDRGAKIAGASNGAHGARPDQILEQPGSNDVRFSNRPFGVKRFQPLIHVRPPKSRHSEWSQVQGQELSFLVWMHPGIRRDLARLGQLDHVHRLGVAAFPT